MAIGQHYGLSTPYLDWTQLPYLALFFALSDIQTSAPECSIYCLNLEEARRHPLFGKDFNVVECSIEENPRIVSQRGNFTFLDGGGDLEDFFYQRAYISDDILLKCTYDKSNRESDLAQLEKMNISWLTLFPDLDGVAKYCNQTLI